MGAIDRSGSVKDDVVARCAVGSDHGIGVKHCRTRERKNSRRRALVSRPVQVDSGRVNILLARGKHVIQIRSSRAGDSETRKLVGRSVARSDNTSDVHIASSARSDTQRMISVHRTIKRHAAACAAAHGRVD